MKKSIRYSPINNEFDSLVMIDKIIHMTKSYNGSITYIHLSTGNILESDDSINTLEARINSEE